MRIVTKWSQRHANGIYWRSNALLFHTERSIFSCHLQNYLFYSVLPTLRCAKCLPTQRHAMWCNHFHGNILSVVLVGNSELHFFSNLPMKRLSRDSTLNILASYLNGEANMQSSDSVFSTVSMDRLHVGSPTIVADRHDTNVGAHTMCW